ncbi:MAG TPA: hypothetical protein GXX26_01645 [Clostridiaceae bacterium]|jgi:hypothetical protein|nr:hypothetical protein [Clostridiaceae bacterium]
MSIEKCPEQYTGNTGIAAIPREILILNSLSKFGDFRLVLILMLKI